MEIKRIATDALHEIIVLKVVNMDYKGQVAKRINEKMPLATVKGFRKGAVPKDLVAKQYGKPIKIEEVNKVVELALERYIQSERLNLLGTPLIKTNENFSWDNEELEFEYEIGLAPIFELNLETSNNVIKYVVTADEKMINEQLVRIQKQYGNSVPKDQVSEASTISGVFSNEENNINATTTLTLDIFKDKTTAEKFIGKNVGDVVTVNTKGLFKEDSKLVDILKISRAQAQNLEIEVDFKLENINEIELATLNQELFDKLFGSGTITSIEELKARIKNDAETQFEEQASQLLIRDVQNVLIENTKFDLPETFLKKWLQSVSEKNLSDEEANAEYEKTEKGLRYQMIEGKAMAQNDIKVNFEDLKFYTSKMIRQQMAQFGQANASDQEVEGIVARVLSNQDEVKKLSQEVVKEKLLQLFVEKANVTTKEVTFDEFVATMYNE